MKSGMNPWQIFVCRSFVLQHVEDQNIASSFEEEPVVVEPLEYVTVSIQDRFSSSTPSSLSLLDYATLLRV